MDKSQPTPAVQQFNEAIYILLKANTAKSRSLLAFIRRTLWSYSLDKQLTVVDVFIEAYTRGVQYLGQAEGEIIETPSAWMRVTALNVIRDKSRERQKFVPLTWEIDAQSNHPEDNIPSFEECFIAVIQAFNCLNHEERNIIQLKHLEGRSWKDVIAKIGESGLTEAAARKRGQRALDKLRKEYHKIRPSSPFHPE
jgi:RNA polymerase sigma factor (sigma-70 family)